MDASLKELTNLIKEVNEESRKKGTIFDFGLIYPGWLIIYSILLNLNDYK